MAFRIRLIVKKSVLYFESQIIALPKSADMLFDRRFWWIWAYPHDGVPRNHTCWPPSRGDIVLLVWAG